MEKKLKQVMELLNKNEQLTKELFTQETPEGAQKVLKNAGVDFTVDEIKHVGKLINQMLENKGRELSEDELTNVAGGGVYQNIGSAVGKLIDGLCNLAGEGCNWGVNAILSSGW
ncbi:MAG: Nif11-like leader peptide family RiPP precursor [Candidatus Riflebacteria bacterium]|nr:Nif11-like leader peptide family RiPP precursor [Candidatus Riflebacteria bacterium]